MKCLAAHNRRVVVVVQGGGSGRLFANNRRQTRWLATAATSSSSSQKSSPATTTSTTSGSKGTATPAQQQQQQSYVNPTAPSRPSFMAQARRAHIRRRMVSRDDPNEDDDAIAIITPRERIGRDYDLNFKLHEYHIAPSREAFHNLHLEGLLHHSTGTLDKNKAIHVHSDNAADQFDVYYGERAPGSIKNANTLSLDNYKALMKEMKEHLTHDVDQLFVHDGAIGSHSKSDARLRAFCDNAESALFLHNVIPKAPRRQAAYEENKVLPDGETKTENNKYDFDHSITAYIAARYQPKNPERFGLKGKSGVVVDIARGIVIVIGTPSTEAVRSGLSAVAAPRLLADKDAVALPADLLSFGDKQILVVSPDNLLPKKGLAGKVAGGHGLAWGANGVSRLFDGATHAGDDVVTKGSLVEHFGKSSRITVKNQPNTHIYAHPSSVVVLVSDDSKTLPPLSKVTSKEAVAPLITGFSNSQDRAAKSLLSSSIPDVYNSKITSLLQGFKGDVYVVNVAAKDRNLSDQEVTDVLKAIAEGKAAGAPSSSGVFSALSPITSISGVSAVIDPAKRGWNASSYKAEASKWEESVSKYVESITPKQEASKDGKEPPKPPAWAKYLRL